MPYGYIQPLSENITRQDAPHGASECCPNLLIPGQKLFCIFSNIHMVKISVHFFFECHDDVWESGSIAPLILNLYIRWGGERSASRLDSFK
jgi:hypothetical protein